MSYRTILVHLTDARRVTSLVDAAGHVAAREKAHVIGLYVMPPIPTYATAGAGVGPWCSYFVSWAAKQAGAPLGEAGQGFGAVSSAWDWAKRTGRTIPAGQTPQAGDLIVWNGTHIGIVESVDADGKVHTIEGNSSNAVTRRTHDRNGDGATGYIRF